MCVFEGGRGGIFLPSSIAIIVILIILLLLGAICFHVTGRLAISHQIMDLGSSTCATNLGAPVLVQTTGGEGSYHTYHFCRNKHMFVVTKHVFLSQQKYACPDKHKFVVASILLWFVVTNITLVAAPANDKCMLCTQR